MVRMTSTSAAPHRVQLDRSLTVRLTAAELAAIEAAAREEERPTSAMLRRLVRLGLEGSRPARRAE